MSKAMLDLMKMEALQDLYTGNIMPWDKEILADMPLPSDIVDPFASEEADPLTVMNLTYVSLSGWIAEAKKEKYYTERFIQLSKLVMKGVTVMGRGLASLHKQGDDLSRAPMQIDDLICVGSYHFRKSYLGVVQFSPKHPEIGERLLVNQLSWSNMLMRLHKTKEKLALPEAKACLNEEVRSKNEELPDGNPENSSSLPLHSSSDHASALPGSDEKSASGAGAFSGIDAIFAPAAFSAHRALASFPKNKRSEEEETGTKSKGRERPEIGNRESEITGKPEISGRETMNPAPREAESEDFSDRETEVPPAETRSKPEDKADEQTPDIMPDEEENSSSFTDHPSSGLPPYLEVIRNIMERSEPSENGELTFTWEEMVFLANDPEFNRMNPRAADQFRDILAKISAETGEDSS